jgi:hypothetical protein
MYNNEKKLQEKFIFLLKEKIPRHLANTLMEMLPLEKEAIYRRLRGEVAFSFFEMATLSSSLSISLDNIAEIASPYRSQWYHLHIRDYCEFKPIDLNMSYNYIKAIIAAAGDPNSEFGIAANMIPLHIGLLHLPVYRIYLLKWRYQSGKTPRNKLSYSDIRVPEAEKKTYQQYLDAVRKIKYTFFIWDNSFFLSLINDINYFYNVRMITRTEMQMLKLEMFRLLDTLEHFADEGQFDTGNKVETYVSDLDFDSTYTYLSSDNMSICMNSVYSLGAFTSLEKEACEEMKNWVLGLKKSSVLISGAAQYDKIMFFEKQREMLEKHFVIDEEK